MVYKKYIKRDGKTYGPYIYHSKRVDGKVVSEYHGPKTGNNFKKYVWIFLGIFVFAMFFLLASRGGITGNVALELQANYEVGEPLDGTLSFALKEGELLPADTKLVFENDGNTYDFFLKDIISEKTVEGDFYVEGKNIFGTGEGYGKEGTSNNLHAVSFILDIYSSKDTSSSEENTDETIVQENDSDAEEVEEPIQEVVEELEVESTTEETESESEITTDESTEETTSAPITGGAITSFFRWRGTGNVVLELNNEVEGEATMDEPFIYELSSGQTAELRPKSVRDGSEILSDNAVKVNIENNLVTVTTDYFVKESGFGNDFLGENLQTYSIKLSDLDLIFNEGELKISFVYSEEEIISITTMLSSDSVVEGQVLTKPEVTEETESVEQTFSETQTEISLINLTNEERQILINEFGNINIETIRKEIVGSNIIIGYKFGEYRIEYVYDYSESQEVVDKKSENDRILWLKQIASTFVKEDNSFELPKEDYQI